MKASPLHRACAHPVFISCLLGALGFNAAMYRLISIGVPLRTLISQPGMLVLIPLTFVCATLSGSIVGMLAFWPFVRRACSRFNGAPSKVGDAVLILAGRRRGTMAKVCEITVGPGGWELVRLDISPQDRMKRADIFEQYSVLRIPAAQQAAAGISRGA